MPLFVGEFEQSIDAKHRMSISSALREGAEEADGENFYLLLGPDMHLWLYPEMYYRKVAAKIQESPIPGTQQAALQRLFGTARLVKPDKQGRVVLPEKSMQRAVISDEVTLVGSGDHIEIWPREEWEQAMEQTLPTWGSMLQNAAKAVRTAEPTEG